MSSVLTVQANLNGNATSLVSAAKQASAAIKGVDAAAAAATRNSSKMAIASDRVGKALGFAANGAVALGSGIVRMGTQAIGTLVRIATRATMVGAAMATMFAGAALKQGLDRLMSIQDSTVALTRMLGGAAEAAELTDKVLKVVQGTPFAFPQFAEATRQLVAFGVQADKIPGVLTAIADSAAASGEGAEAVGRITQAFARMAVTGKMDYDIIQSLGSAGVNALGLLANHFGVTTQEAQEMVSSGMIPAADAMDILVDGIENGSKGIAGDFKSLKGAAQDLGKTISGSIGNVKAAFARMGAAWLKPFEKDFPDVMNKGVIPLLDKVGAAGQKMTQRIADTGVLKKVTEWFGRMSDNIDPLISDMYNLWKTMSPLSVVWEALKSVLPQVRGPLSEAARTVGESLVPAFADLMVALTPLIPALAELAPVLADGLVAVMPALTTGIQGLVGVVGALADVAQMLPDPLLGILTALIGLNKLGVPVAGIFAGVRNSLTGMYDGAMKADTGMGKIKGSIGGLKGALGGLSGAVTGAFGGPWGLAIAGAVTALTFLATEGYGPAVAAAEDLNGTLDAQTKAITDSTKASIVDALTKNGAAQAYKEMGGNAGDLVDAVIGVEGAQDRVNKVLEHAAEVNEKTKSKLDELGNTYDGSQVSMGKFDSQLSTVNAALGAQGEEIDKLRDKNAIANEVFGFTTKAEQDFQKAIDDASASIKVNGDTLNANSTQGQLNQQALEKVKTAAENLMSSYDMTSTSAAEMTRKQYDSVPALMATFKGMGMSETAAQNLTAEVLNIPKSKVVTIIDNMNAVAENADNLTWKINNIPGYREVVINQVWQETGAPRGEVGAAYNANGAIYSKGVKAFAEGGGVGMGGKRYSRVPQVVMGGANILWGEEETGWEAYISGKKSMLQRNRRVWMDAGERLGMLGGDSTMGGGGVVMHVNVTANASDDIETLAQRVMQLIQFKMGVR